MVPGSYSSFWVKALLFPAPRDLKAGKLLRKPVLSLFRPNGSDATPAKGIILMAVHHLPHFLFVDFRIRQPEHGSCVHAGALPCNALAITLGADDLVAVAYERYHHPEPIVQRKMTVLWLKQPRLAPSRDRPHGRRFPGFRYPLSQRVLPRRLGCYPPLPPGKDAVVNSTTTGSAWKSTSVSIRHAPFDKPSRPSNNGPACTAALTQSSAFPAAAGAKPLKVAAVPLTAQKSTLPRTRPGAARRFLDDELEPQLREARAGLRDVYFVDASHFVFGSFLGYVWCFVRLCIRAAPGRKRYNVLGALHARQPPVDPGGQPAATPHQRHLGVRLAARGRCGQCGASDHAGAGQCPLPEMRPGPGVGPILENPSAVPAFLFAEPEPDRARVEVRQERMLAVGAARELPEAFTAAIDNCLAKLSTTHKKDMKTLLAHKFSRCLILCPWLQRDGHLRQGTRCRSMRQIMLQAVYLLALKDNQPTLYADVQLCFANARASGYEGVSYDTFVTEEVNHGRYEKRVYTVIYEPSGLSTQDEWVDLKAVVEVERTVRVGDKESREVSHYINSSNRATARVLAGAIRGHWGIENGQHWVLDVIFGEDRCRTRQGNAAENLAWLRKMVLSLFRQDDTKGTIPTRQFLAAADDAYRLHMLHLLSEKSA